MAKTDVYSWRVDAETKSALQRAAKQSNRSVGALLDQIVGEWLEAQENNADPGEQKRLHDAVSKCIGVLQRSRPYSAEETRQTIRGRLARKYGRARLD